MKTFEVRDSEDRKSILIDCVVMVESDGNVIECVYGSERHLRAIGKRAILLHKYTSCYNKEEYQKELDESNIGI